MKARVTCCSSIEMRVPSQRTSYGKSSFTLYWRSWAFHMAGSIPCVTVQPVPCLQTVQPRLLCRGSYGTVTHGLRWEFTDTWWAISSVTRFRIALHVLHSSRPENLFGRQGEVAMYIPKWWSTTDLDATGIILQRLGCLSVGT